jgi:hypothetical protein
VEDAARSHRFTTGRHTPRKRSIQYAAAYRFHRWRLWNTGSPPSRGRQLVCADTPSHSRGAIRPRFALKSRPLRSEGAGNAGCPMHPQPRVRYGVVSMHTSIHSESSESPDIPRAMVYGLCRALPGDRLSCHRRLRIVSANLTPASRRQDHTFSPSASAPFVRKRFRVHRVSPRVRDVAQRPSVGTRRREL